MPRTLSTIALALLLTACANAATPATVTPAGGPSPVAPSPAPATFPPTRETTAGSCLTREDLAAMSLVDIRGMSTLCYRSSAGVETQVDQAKALAAIDDFLREPGRVVAFREITTMGNSPDGLLRVARFEDDLGRSFQVAVTANRVLEMDPGLSAPSIRVEGARLTTEELQELAEALIARELPEFVELRSSLISTGGVKSGDLYFFRYEYAGGGPWAGLPPLAQVGITADGQIFSYLNTLYFVV